MSRFVRNDDVFRFRWRIHQMFSPICFTNFSQFEQLKKKLKFLLVRNRFCFSQFATSWKNIIINISFSSSNAKFYKSRIFCLFTFWVFFQDTPKNAKNTLYHRFQNSLNWYRQINYWSVQQMVSRISFSWILNFLTKLGACFVYLKMDICLKIKKYKKNAKITIYFIK